MLKTNRFIVARTASCIRALAITSALACSMLAGAAASVQVATQAEISKRKSTESEGYCGAKPGGTTSSAIERRTSYVLGDSIGFGLQLIGLEARLQTILGGTSRISFDGGRSITSPGHQINKSALESVDIDRDFIAGANVIVIILGTNQIEGSFVQSQRQLMQKLKAIAPQATYYWVDIGATMSTQTDGWSARNKIIYDNARGLGYTVISRYKAIFGPTADPLRIKPGQNFPNSATEPGFGGEGNIHGAYPELSKAILEAVSNVAAVTHGCTTGS